MKNVAYLCAAASLAVAAAPANAVVLTFLGGHAKLDGPQSTSGALTGMNFADIFTFTTNSLATIAGSLTTHSLSDIDRNVVQDLDIRSVTLDSFVFQNFSSSDANEQYALASTALGAGSHTLTINYNIDTASANNLAGYSGDLFLTPGSAFAPAPEAATWAMFLAGFGVAGSALRRRKAVRAVG